MLRGNNVILTNRDVQFSVHSAGLLGEFGPTNVSPQVSPLQEFI